MEFLDQINIGNGELRTLAVLAGVLCCGGVLLLLVFQVLGGALSLFSGVLDIIVSVLEGGPIAWCGCLLLIFGCCACTVFMVAFAGAVTTCGTENPLVICRFLP